MAKKIAIVISGAVSLGSYEAGVVYEVINALKYHNLQTAEPAQQFKIDVIVGTSAGAMTAFALARQLLFDADSLDKFQSNDLYQAWVKNTRIEDLLKEESGDSRFATLFSLHNKQVCRSDVFCNDLRRVRRQDKSSVPLMSHWGESRGKGKQND